VQTLISSRSDVRHNLALEEYLLDHRARFGSVLLLTVNDRAVVIGRNQNPWRECSVALARREGVPIARRFSGGGAVYHDRGNLNYSFIVPRAGYDQGRVFDQVIRALAAIGVSAERQGKSNLAAAGRKISGTAFCFRRDSVVHHGTLLVSADLGRLAGLLRPTLPDLVTHAIPSAPAAVVNLAEVVPGLTLEQVAQTLICEIAPGAPSIAEADLDAVEIGKRAALNAGWETVFGLTPPFEVAFRAEDADLTFRVRNGLVDRATLNSTENVTALSGCRFDATTISAILRERPMDSGLWRSFADTVLAAGF
jgi:lipoate-protein ligase A